MKLTKTNLIALSSIIYFLIYANTYSQYIDLLNINSSGKLPDIKLKLSDEQSFLKLKKEKVSYSMMDIHFGAGHVNGIHTGIRYKIKYISFEASFGYLFSFSSGPTNEYIACAGFNTYPTNEWYFLSFLFSYRKDLFYITPNIGVITMDAVSIVLFARVGASFVLRLNDSDTSGEINFINPCLDLGIGWRFSL